MQFNVSQITFGENETTARAVITRTGDTSTTSSVEFLTTDGTALQTNDYLTASGIVTFAAGETGKTLDLLLINDAYQEATEAFSVTLRNPQGATLGSNAALNVNLVDDDTNPPTANPAEEAQFFVRQHYYDFLSRTPDDAGLVYWANQLTECGRDATCLRGRRLGVSAAFFIELEFQETGFVVYRLHRAAFGTRQMPDQTRANVSYAQFMADRAQLTGGPALPASTADFAARFVQRPAFLAVYPATQPNAQFVNTLFDNAGLVASEFSAVRQAELDAMNTQGRTRAQVLLNVANLNAFRQREYNPAFVLMQYFGYLRRDPDQTGYDFWLQILNQQPANANGMVCAFLTSAEYQQRFSSVTPRSNAECGP